MEKGPFGPFSLALVGESEVFGCDLPLTLCLCHVAVAESETVGRTCVDCHLTVVDLASHLTLLLSVGVTTISVTGFSCQ